MGRGDRGGEQKRGRKRVKNNSESAGKRSSTATTVVERGMGWVF